MGSRLHSYEFKGVCEICNQYWYPTKTTSVSTSLPVCCAPPNPTKCIEFYEVIARNSKTVKPSRLLTLFEEAWKEDALLAMKLVLQLQKSNVDGFLPCLHWMYQNHFRTLLRNMEYLKWSNLLSLVHITYSGQISSLSDHLESLGKVKHATQSRDENKARRKAQKVEQADRLDEMLRNDKKFAILHRSIVRMFQRGLQKDLRVLKRGTDLSSISDTSIWAPTINRSVDVYTNIGKRVALSLHFFCRDQRTSEPEEDYNKEAFQSYKENYLAPLRATVKKNILESSLSLEQDKLTVMAAGAILPEKETKILESFFDAPIRSPYERMLEILGKLYVDLEVID